MEVTHFKDSTSLLKNARRDEQLVKCAFLKEILYLFIRMVTKQTLVIIALHIMYQHCSNYYISCTNTVVIITYHAPTLNKTISCNLLSRITPYVDEITGDNQCEL